MLYFAQESFWFATYLGVSLAVRAMYYQIDDRPLRAIIAFTAFPLTSFWVKAVQFNKLDGSAELGRMIGYSGVVLRKPAKN